MMKIVGDDDSASRSVWAIHESPECANYNKRGNINVRNKIL